MSAKNNATARVTLVNLDLKNKPVEAQYNPKELSLSKGATWQPHPNNKSDNPGLDYTGSPPRSLSLELMFDTFEEELDVHKEYIVPLLELVSVMNQEGREHEKRPPRVSVAWGTDLPNFVGVIESVETKYTMFLPSGRPVRATATVKIKESTAKLAAKKAR